MCFKLDKVFSKNIKNVLDFNMGKLLLNTWLGKGYLICMKLNAFFLWVQDFVP